MNRVSDIEKQLKGINEQIKQLEHSITNLGDIIADSNISYSKKKVGDNLIADLFDDNYMESLTLITRLKDSYNKMQYRLSCMGDIRDDNNANHNITIGFTCSDDEDEN